MQFNLAGNIAQMNTFNTNTSITLNREENDLNINDSYLEIELITSDNDRCVFGNDGTY